MRKKEKIMTGPSFNASSLKQSLNKHRNATSSVDNQMDGKYVVRTNETLRKVPNFVHMNINQNEDFDAKAFNGGFTDTYDAGERTLTTEQE
jgi:hypothetical protein